MAHDVKELQRFCSYLLLPSLRLNCLLPQVRAHTHILCILISKMQVQNSIPLLVSQVALVAKNLPASAADLGDVGSIPGSGRSLEEEMATHANILAWRIPRTEEPGWATVHGVAKRHD